MVSMQYATVLQWSEEDAEFLVNGACGSGGLHVAKTNLQRLYKWVRQCHSTEASKGRSQRGQRGRRDRRGRRAPSPLANHIRFGRCLIYVRIRRGLCNILPLRLRRHRCGSLGLPLRQCRGLLVHPLRRVLDRRQWCRTGSGGILKRAAAESAARETRSRFG